MSEETHIRSEQQQQQQQQDVYSDRPAWSLVAKASYIRENAVVEATVSAEHEPELS